MIPCLFIYFCGFARVYIKAHELRWRVSGPGSPRASSPRPLGAGGTRRCRFPFKSNSGNENAQENSAGASGSSRKQLDLHRAIKK